jgi:hypothetical protein
MYARIGEGATKRGIAELNGDNDIDGDAGVTIGKPGKCVRIYCGGKVGFYLCVDPSPDPRNIPYSSKDLGQQLEDTFKDCYGGYPENSDRGQWAFQFWGPGYNLLAHGNVNDCDVPEEY